jgi:hypothetical protein
MVNAISKRSKNISGVSEGEAAFRGFPMQSPLASRSNLNCAVFRDGVEGNLPDPLSKVLYSESPSFLCDISLWLITGLAILFSILKIFREFCQFDYGSSASFCAPSFAHPSSISVISPSKSVLFVCSFLPRPSLIQPHKPGSTRGETRIGF